MRAFHIRIKRHIRNVCALSLLPWQRFAQMGLKFGRLHLSAYRFLCLPVNFFCTGALASAGKSLRWYLPQVQWVS